MLFGKEDKDSSLNFEESNISDQISDFSSKSVTQATRTKKNFLGGYINKVTGKVYHHAIVQTLPPLWKQTFVTRYSRDSQTVTFQDKSLQTPREASTQIPTKTVCLKSTESDRTLEARQNYECDDKEYLIKIITLQKYVRRWLVQKEILKRKKSSLLAIEQLDYKSQQDADWLKQLEERKLSPKSNEDFLLLFSDLQKWWEFQAKCLADVRSGADLKAAMWMLVNIETKQISQINKTRNVFEQEKILEDREECLGKAAKPKLWKASGGKIEVYTKNTQRASSLQELYATLSTKYLSAQERVDALTNLKEVLKPYNCQLTDSLNQLANREIDLLLRGIKLSSLEGLQSRIRNLFWQLCKKPVFNPEMQAMSKVQEYNTFTPYILTCGSCKCFYTLGKDSINEALGKSVLESYLSKCVKCKNLEREAWNRKDLELYKQILKLLISEEEKIKSASSIIYHLQSKDIGYLVENIWKHQSCISGIRNDIDLQFVRYDMDKSWTPWNCLLVTKKEATTLLNNSNPRKNYDEMFQVQVSQKHTEARQYFSTIPRFLPYLTRAE